MGQAEVPVADPLVPGGVQVQSPHQELPDDGIEGRFCIKKENEDGLLQALGVVVDGGSEEECCQLVTCFIQTRLG